MSLEAADIYSHMHREMDLHHNYCGMIPYSLELIKLRDEGLKIIDIEDRDKEISRDIINVKFEQKVKSGSELKKILNRKKEKRSQSSSDTKENSYDKKLSEFLNIVEDNLHSENWNEVNVNDLRKILYTDGFKMKFKNKRTGSVKVVEYVSYKRSSSKSRTGQCLFIRKSLYNRMIKWSRLGLPFRKNMKIDLAGLLAYESLVGSSLEDTMTIDPNKILMVDDVYSNFNRICNVVRKGNNGFLDSFTEEIEVSNSLFDGESLLDERYFEDGVSMKLLRNHMFKSAAFNCNIQMFLRDNCPSEIEYDDWKIEDMFNNKIKAKDIEMITTPSSLKAFKFSEILGSRGDMWDYWKQKVVEDGSVFGICKNEKKSKLGKDEQGNILQQTSYQMLNSLHIKKSSLKELIKTEENYIMDLKNNEELLLEKIKEDSNLMNSNEMMVHLAEHNKNFINTMTFKKFKKKYIWSHVNHAKKGKIKLAGDYCVLLGNPMEFLYHSIGKMEERSQTLIDNEVFTNLFPFDKEYVSFRNPHTSPSNVLVVKNKSSEDIQKYFNLTKNIVCVNAIKFPIQDILSGCDYDSDTMLVIDHPEMLKLGKECFEKYNVCINDIEGQKKEYRLNKHDAYEIDNQLSTSQMNIGRVVNLGQFCMSVYWDLMNRGINNKETDELLKKIDIMTILSGIAIDMAKKFYEIDINKEIKHVEKNKTLKERSSKPLFWKYVSQNKNIKTTHYNCPMDFTIEYLSNINYATRTETVPFEILLKEENHNNPNYRQSNKIIERIQKMDDMVKHLNASIKEKEKRKLLIEEEVNNCLNYIKKLKLNINTMHTTIKYTLATNEKIMVKILNVLYQTHQELFLNSFKNDPFLQEKCR